MKSPIIGFTLALGLSASALSTGALAEPYIGVGVGSTDYGVDNFDDPTGINLYLGSRASETVAIEAFYTDFGTAKDTLFNDVELNISNFGAGLLIGPELAPGANLFINVGIHAWDGEVSLEFTGFHYDDSGSDLYYGFGGSFEIARGLALGARYTKYVIGEDEDI